jgi:hypothetical protein
MEPTITVAYDAHLSMIVNMWLMSFLLLYISVFIIFLICLYAPLPGGTQIIKQMHTFAVEEFKRFRRKPELLLLTGVKIVLLKVWRTVLDLLRGGRGGRHLISFFKTGIVGCFSKTKHRASRLKSIPKGTSFKSHLLTELF